MPRRAALAAALFAAFACVPTPALSQQQPAPVQQLQVAPAQTSPEPQPAPAPPAQSNPGLVEEIGKLLKDSAAGIRDSAKGLTSKLPSAKDTLEGINNTAKGATDSLTRITPPLANQTVVAGRAICPPAGNGAPDCKIASDMLCKEKGYREGRSMDIETSQKCSAKDYLAGRGACHTENFVTRAVCQ